MNYLLAAWLCMPSLLMVYLSLSSLAIGLIFTSLAAMFSIVLLNFDRRIQISGPYLTILVAAVISVLVAHYATQQPFTQKQGLAIVGLVVLAFAAPTVLRHYFSRKANRVSRELKWIYLAFVVIGLIGVVAPIRIGPFLTLDHPVFPFSEPSHYALAYAQIASFVLLFLGQKGRLLIVATTLLLALGFPNVTMLAVTILLLLITASIRVLLFVGLAGAALTGYLTSLYPDKLAYFTGRLLSDEAENLSRLVYVQGWESLVSANVVSNGLGIGFQNLGNEPPGLATEIIRTLTNGIDLNRLDGGFLFAKIGGEFGVLGIIIGSSLVILAVLSGIRLRHELKSRLNMNDAFPLIPLCSTYIFAVELLIRGVGYFSPTLVLTVYFMARAVQILRNKTSIIGGIKKIP